MTVTTHGPRRTMTRTAMLAGIVTAGTAALTLPLATGASAEDTGQSIARTAERTDAPAAYAPAPSQDALGKAPRTGDDAQDAAGNGDAAGDAGPEDRAHDRHHGDGDDSRDRAENGDREEAENASAGRGAEYGADGSLTTIERHEQPKPEPASDEDIDRWIDKALEVLDEEGIPATHEGIHRNLMRESSGDPRTINMWDTNAEKNIPSKGLLQVIDPTFEQYHVEGTSTDIYDPVANIAAACNYAAERYGSMDNVDSAY
jgi:hypothetical protein